MSHFKNTVSKIKMKNNYNTEEKIHEDFYLNLYIPVYKGMCRRQYISGRQQRQ